VAAGAQDGRRAGDEELNWLSAATQKTRILSNAFRRGGAHGLVEVLAQKLRSTWRRGEVWQLGKFVGMPTGIIRLDACKFSIAKEDVPANIVDLLLSGLYEEPERKALKQFLDPELPVVELGACIGVVSCITNRRLRKPERHVVVEANPRLLPLLEQNRARNDCHFMVVHAAVSHGAETIAFNIDDNILASSVNGDGQQGVVVSTATLERLLNEHGFASATLICDIEGAELQLVEHELKTLSERVVMIIMELHERIVGLEPTQRMLRALHGVGFKVEKRDGDVIVLRKR
jgi:FkbM family methyltransferase